MYAGDLIGAQEICNLLQISRPTLNSYRKKYDIADFKIKREVKFSKTEILSKLYIQLNPIKTKHNFDMYSDVKIDWLKIDDTTYDLRQVGLIDGYGGISLLCHITHEIDSGKYIHLLIDQRCTFLKRMNFFGELKRYLNSKIFWDEQFHKNIENIENIENIKLPIRRLGVVGSQNSIVDDLSKSLELQGYSLEVRSYIGWAMGELADNSVTHAKKYPAFVYFEQYGDDRRYLQFTIGDIGIGIPKSLKGNETYKQLSDIEALITAFRPYVSGRSDEEDRGKGLTDVLKIAMECSSSLRADSNGLSVAYSFNSGIDKFQKIDPVYHGNGTVISILFIDGTFGSVEREEVEKYIEECSEKI